MIDTEIELIGELSFDRAIEISDDQRNREESIIRRTIVEYSNHEIQEIGNRSFSYCYELTTVDIPNVKYIRQYAFVYCNALVNIILPNATTFEYAAFQDCVNLTRVELPIADALPSMLFNRTNLTTLVLSRTDKIVTLGSIAALTNTPIANGTGYIYVPDNLVNSYKSATNWSTYASQIKPLSELQ